VPVGGQTLERDVQHKDALRVERTHDLDALLPVRGGPEARSAGDGGGDPGTVELLDEALVLAVGGELDHVRVDQLLIRRAAQRQVVEIGVELGIPHDQGEAHLVAARQLDVARLGSCVAGREAGVERRFVPVEVDPLRRHAAVPDLVGRLQSGKGGDWQ
jgi:hypothetical protein